jgi:hypothetical protein
MDFAFITPNVGDLTEVQAGTGISVADGTGPIPVVTNTVATAFDAKGDLVVGTGADTFAKLTVGTDGHTLVADSSTATGLAYAAPAGGGANWSLLNAGGTALTGAATITVSGISSKDKLMVLVKDCSSANASSDFRIRLNTDSGNNYYPFGQFNVVGSTYRANNISVETGAAAAGFLMGGMSSNAGSYLAGYAMITGCNAAGVKIIQSVGGISPTGGNGQVYTSLGGYYDSATVISSVSIVSSTGNFDAGTIYVYTSA